MENSDMVAKVLLLGKTKAGKSSFINCFLGKEVAQTGGGKPITQFFTEYRDENGKYPIAIYDSKGIEACEANNQKDEIIDYVKKKNNSDDVFDWFHTIFYCVPMNKGRFQDFEANFIKELRAEIGQHIHIILTHCDEVSPDTIQSMRGEIEKKIGDMRNIRIFETVCTKKEKVNGEVVEPQGIEAVSEKVFELFLCDIADKISKQYACAWHAAMKNIGDDVYNEMNKVFDDVIRVKTLIDAIKDEDSLEERLDAKSEEIENRIEKECDEVNYRFNKILGPVCRLYISYRNLITYAADFAEDIELSFEDVVYYHMDEWVENSDKRVEHILKEILPYMYKNGIMDEDGEFLVDDDNLWDILKGLKGAVVDLVWLKKNCKKFIKSLYDDFCMNIPDESELQKNAYNRIVDSFNEQWDMITTR